MLKPGETRSYLTSLEPGETKVFHLNAVVAFWGLLQQDYSDHNKSMLQAFVQNWLAYVLASGAVEAAQGNGKGNK